MKKIMFMFSFVLAIITSAIIASALTCTSIGAQKSIKNRDEIENYLKKYKF